MKLSARNQLKGKLIELIKGATTSHVTVEIGSGERIVSPITNEAADELRLQIGMSVVAVVKASDVMIGFE